LKKQTWVSNNYCSIS